MEKEKIRKKSTKKRIIIISVVIIVLIILAIILLMLFFPDLFEPPGPDSEPSDQYDSRKAFIVASANDFQTSQGEDEFNEGIDATFESESGRWQELVGENWYGGRDNDPGRDGTPGVLKFITNFHPLNSGKVKIEYIYNWTEYYELHEFGYYNLSAWTNIVNQSGAPTSMSLPGVRVGLRWLNSTNGVIRTDWSSGVIFTGGKWVSLSVTSMCDNSSSNQISQMHLVLAAEGDMNQDDVIYFDDVRVERWLSVNVSDPINPLPSSTKIDSDGFPAQALQVYWILKNKGYSDDNIFLMLYHTGDSIIDIDKNDEISNDLTNAVIDVENDNVTAARLKNELNISIQESFASGIQETDQLLIYMVDHGSNQMLSGNNATFHFEADDSYITELEFIDLVTQIDCEWLMVNIDACFSGNFLNQNSQIGESWYDISNSILITSTTDLFSWYWSDNNNEDGFAGSWFFHHFWDQLDKNKTIETAFNFANEVIPADHIHNISAIQHPLLHDNLGISDDWSFNQAIQND